MMFQSKVSSPLVSSTRKRSSGDGSWSLDRFEFWNPPSKLRYQYCTVRYLVYRITQLPILVLVRVLILDLNGLGGC